MLGVGPHFQGELQLGHPEECPDSQAVGVVRQQDLLPLEGLEQLHLAAIRPATRSCRIQRNVGMNISDWNGTCELSDVWNDFVTFLSLGLQNL